MTAAPSDTPPTPTVQCPNCDTVLAEVVAPGKLKRGPMTVSGPSGRGLRVQCDCGHSFRWLGGAAVDPQDVHHVVQKPPKNTPAPLDILDHDVHT